VLRAILIRRAVYGVLRVYLNKARCVWCVEGVS
jgi:hypothetical protein